ncbi:regucalcin-like isoform X2 [Plodia interpunctella]|uniref:regucalcin-like isoform X2 n=1 Tax=Plodia interpunctella TaxID=58824 RepID=UPI0023687D56|nr:regucalcin-like isoform X2 [Plodia interpunctella]
MSYKFEQISEPLVLGEGPHWDDRTQALYYISNQEPTIHKYVLATKEHIKTKPSGYVSFIIPVEGKPDYYVVSLERRFVVVHWDGQNNSEVKIVKELFEVDQQTKNYINDGKVDPRGRLYAGTMSHQESPGVFAQGLGSLFRLDGSKNIRTLATDVTISNGLAWDEPAKIMYYVDSKEKRIRRYDWDPDTGDISNLKYVVDFEKSGVEGVPDGGTIDTDGNLWWAVFDGSCVLQINPKAGKILRKIEIPAKQVTSCTFGGPNYDILFVTTANFTGDQPPPSGATFMVTGLGAKGHPNRNFKLE